MLKQSSKNKNAAMQNKTSSLELIQSMAELTCLTDRDDLAVSMCITLFEMLQCSQIRFYRAVDTERGAALQLNVQFSENGISRFQPTAMAEPAEQLPADKLLQQAVSSDGTLLVSEDSRRAVMTLRREKQLYALFDLCLQNNLQPVDYRMLQGLAKIYENHLALLDYSETDTLTTLRNRKTLEKQFSKITAMLQSFGTEPTPADAEYYLVVIDIDHFKRVNDSYGHLYGDEILLLIAQLMQRTFRSNDRLFRFGGEEFVAILGPQSQQGVELALERFRSRVEQYAFPQVKSMTVSLGVTRIRPFEVLSMTMGRADTALYQAKSTGRNQIVFYNEPTPTAAGDQADDDVLF